MGAKPSQLQVYDCNKCINHKVGALDFPCNRCYSLNANCIEQHFKSKEKDVKPFLSLPLSETERLTVELDQLSFENFALKDKVNSLELRLKQLENYLMEGQRRERQVYRQSYEEKLRAYKYKMQQIKENDQLEKAMAKMNRKMEKGRWI
jgi:uncharacterized protein (DUF488 family)